MDHNNMGNTNESDDSNGDGNSPHEHQGDRSRLLSDSLYDGPLNHIISNHPKLFVKPQDWTERHARFLHVVCKEERLIFWTVTQHSQSTKQQKYEILIQRVDKSTSGSQESEEMQQDTSLASDTDTDMLRVPSFRFPSLPHPHLNSHIARLSSERAGVSNVSRRIAMESLLVWKRPRPSNIWRTLLNPDHVAPEPIKTCSYKGDNGIKDVHHELKVEFLPLAIKYGKRRISVGFKAPTYTLAGDTSYAQRNAWRLIYVDRAEWGIGRPLSEAERRDKRMMMQLRAALGILESPNGKDARDGWPVNQGCMAGLFIAMAQQRQEEQQARLSTANTREASRAPSHSTSQLQPRYQILLTTDAEISPYIQLYTAHVSDFLLEHFRTPAHRPQTALSEHEPHLLKIHRCIIPFSPYKSFRCRLRMAIMEYANGTADGFFSDPNPTPDGEQEGAASAQQQQQPTQTSQRARSTGRSSWFPEFAWERDRLPSFDEAHLL
ncbi:hypothetical protein F4801DRAFT_282261 [Xylaria longipes]|nr:hypothetical protein F4801DRAFT_282261 [Xylaria longipes]